MPFRVESGHTAGNALADTLGTPRWLLGGVGWAQLQSIWMAGLRAVRAHHLRQLAATDPLFGSIHFALCFYPLGRAALDESFVGSELQTSRREIETL